jgi:nucleoside-diphosphate-sugar epimerase
MTVLVIGSSGYLGRYVVEALTARGHDVVGFDLAPTGDAPSGTDGQFTAERGDMTSFADLSDAITAHDVDAAVQLAYFGTPTNGLLDSAEREPYHATNANVTGFANVLEAARQFDLDALAWASSTVVYGRPAYYESLGIDPVDETAPTAPESLYGACKEHNEYLAAMYAEEYGLDVAGIRLPLIYGPERYPGAQPFIVDMFETVADGGHIELADGDTTWDLLYERDVGELFAAVLAAGEYDHDAYNIVGHTVTVRDLARLAERAGPEGASVTAGDGDAEVIPAPLSDERFRAEFDFRPEYDAGAAVVDYLETLTADRHSSQ